MSLGSLVVAWSRMYLRKKSALSRVDFFCSNFALRASQLFDNALNLYAEILNFLISIFGLSFCSVCFLFDLDRHFFLDLFHVVWEDACEHDISLNDILGWRRSRGQRYVNSWSSVTAKNAMTSSDHSMKNGLTPSNDVGWGTLGLRRWSWANILISAPSLRWNSHLSLLAFPDYDVTIICDVFVFDVIILVGSCAHQALLWTCSATMSKWRMKMTRKWNWPEQELERDFTDLNCLSISAWGACDTMIVNDDDMMRFWDPSERTPLLTWANEARPVQGFWHLKPGKC